MLKMNWLLVALLTSLLVACSGPSLQERGDENLQRGNYEAAASNYEAALAEDPDNDELRRKYERAADLAVGANLEEARMAMNDGDWEGAVFKTATALEWGAERQDVKNWATGFDQRLAEEVTARAEGRDFPSAVALANAADEYLPPRFHADTMRARDGAIASWESWLLTEARTAESNGHLATATLFLTEAAVVTGDATHKRAARSKAEQIRGDHRVTYSVRARNSGGSGVLDHVPEFVGSAAVVRGKIASSDLEVEVDLRDLRVVDDTFTETRSKSYVAGHENRKNPEWLKKNRRLNHLEREIDDAKIRESRARRAAQADPSPRNDAIYRAAKDEVDILEDRKREHERELFHIDEFIREEVHAVHHWDVQTVKRTALATVVLRWKDPLTGRMETRREPIHLVEEDFSQQGYRDAGVSHDPLVLPSIAEMEGRTEAAAAELVHGILEEAYNAHLVAAMERVGAAHGATEAAALGIVLDPWNPPAGVVSKFVGLSGVRSSIAESVVGLES